MTFPSDIDPDREIEALLADEFERQTTGLQLIASENFTSPAVIRAMGSVLTNKYSEGYPGKRYYGGNTVIDGVEALAIERAMSLFGAEHANVQPHSGANANMSAYQALLAARRHRARAQPRPRRAPDPRVSRQRQRPDLQLRRLQGDAGRRAHRHGPGARSRPRAPSEDDRRRHDELSAPPRARAVPRHRRRGRRVVPVRRRAHRRTRRRWRPARPRALRRRRHADDAQDAARAARRHDPVSCRARQGDRQGGVPGLAGRSARARHRRQGDRLP